MEVAQILVVIPAYKPNLRMLTLCEALRAAEFPVMLVDDGSGEAYRDLFQQAETLGCHVERHAVNMGKGRALKTGINAAMNLYPELAGVVTADADGQHTCADILRIMATMGETPDTLITGARCFGKNVPFKSRAGNTITRYVYRFATGIRCKDTQTGLRGIPAKFLPSVLCLPGERYEYEMTMLMKLKELSLPLKEIEIEAIYLDNNKGSHFHPFMDSLRIYTVILRFLTSSLLSFGLDYALYLFCLRIWLLSPGQCYVIARVFSSLFNYTLNRTAVFGGRGGKFSIFRYYLLALLIMAAGSGFVELLAFLGFGAGWVKIPVDTLLFFVSYLLQRDYVFRGKTGKGKQQT